MRFRLRTGFAFITVLCVALCVVSETTRAWRNRGRITSELTSLGASYVGFDERGNPTWVSFVERMRSAEIARYKTLQQVDLAHSAVRDEDLCFLIGLPELIAIHLTDTAVTDVGMRHLTSIESLQIIRLENTFVTDAALESMARMPALKAVDVSNTRITSTGIATLKARRPDVTIRAMGVGSPKTPPIDDTRRAQ